MKRCRVLISNKLFFKLLKIPKKAGIMGIELDAKHDCVCIYLNNVGKELPECAVAEVTAVEDL